MSQHTLAPHHSKRHTQIVLCACCKWYVALRKTDSLLQTLTSLSSAHGFAVVPWVIRCYCLNCLEHARAPHQSKPVSRQAPWPAKVRASPRRVKGSARGGGKGSARQGKGRGGGKATGEPRIGGASGKRHQVVYIYPSVPGDGNEGARCKAVSVSASALQCQ